MNNVNRKQKKEITMFIEEGTFAEACYNQNTIKELKEARKEEADETDMKEWGLNETEWREQIELAIAAMEEDEQQIES